MARHQVLCTLAWNRVGLLSVETVESETAMKLDLLYEIDVPKPWPGPHPYGQRQASSRPTGRRSSRSGWPTSWASTPPGTSSTTSGRAARTRSAPEVIIGALSQVTEQIRLGFGVMLMPHAFTPPVRVAEKVATADVLSDGRVEWGTGRSTPMEQTAFGVDPARARPRQWRRSRPSCRCGSRSTSSSTASTGTSRSQPAGW